MGKTSNTKKSNGKNTAVIIVCAILALIFIIVLCVYLIINDKLNKINIVDKGQYIEVTTTASESTGAVEATTEAGAQVPADENDQLDEAESKGQNFYSDESQVASAAHVRNILLIGVDNRHYEDISKVPGNSDVMILISINSKTNKIFMTSFMRDTYAYIDYPAVLEKYNVDGSDKLNEANARGGPELLLDTIEGNFKVKVDEYVAVDFYSLIDIIDILGGVTLTISDEQASVMNNYIRDMDLYRPSVSDYVNENVFTKGGTYLMNGTQAVAYCRDRYSGGNDYKRTDKQREVLALVFEKAKKMSISQLNELADTVLPMVYTNISKNDILTLISGAGSYLTYDLEQLRVPFDGMFTSATATTKYGNQGVLIPDYEATAAKLKQSIYGE